VKASSMVKQATKYYWFYYTNTYFVSLIHPTTAPAYTSSVSSFCNGATLQCALGSTSYTITSGRYYPKGGSVTLFYR
jgi:hypothetical protein